MGEKKYKMNIKLSHNVFGKKSHIFFLYPLDILFNYPLYIFLNLRLSRLIIDPTNSLTVRDGAWSSICLLLLTNHQSIRNNAKAKILMPAQSPTYLKYILVNQNTFLLNTIPKI